MEVKSVKGMRSGKNGFEEPHLSPYKPISALIILLPLTPTHPPTPLSQVRYMLGDAGRSLVVGVGKNPPKRTQDRGAACPDPPEVKGVGGVGLWWGGWVGGEAGGLGSCLPGCLLDCSLLGTAHHPSPQHPYTLPAGLQPGDGQAVARPRHPRPAGRPGVRQREVGRLC